MEILIKVFFRTLEFFSAGAPIICIILDMKNESISSKHALLRLSLFLIINVYYLWEIKELFAIIYHIIPIISAYIYWFFSVKERKQLKTEKKDIQDE